MAGHSQESLLTVDPFVGNLIALLDLPNWFNKDWIHLMAPYRNDLTRVYMPIDPTVYRI